MFGFSYFLSSAIVKNVIGICLLVGGGIGGYYGVKYVKKIYNEHQYKKEIKENYENRKNLPLRDSLRIITV